MELKIATLPELRQIYETLLRPAFPPAELKPLSSMESLLEDGGYAPLVLADGDGFLGACFLWLGVPGWALLDYLCVHPDRRSGGCGAEMLRLMREAYPDWVILAEAETPALSPDPAMAERRLGFYARNQASMAQYESEAFGVRYKTLYWSAAPVSEEALMRQHRFIYESCFDPEVFKKYVRIPRPANAPPMPQIPWIG